MPAANMYVAPNGTPSGKGTKGRPYDLATAVSGSVSGPGDTFWLREGVYRLGNAYTEMHGDAGRPITFREMPGERAKVVGSLTIGGDKGHLVFRDFELCSGVNQRVSKQAGAGFGPSDLTNFIEGIQVGAPNISFINVVVHDSVRSAIYTAPEATNTLIYGCIVYNAGWVSSDNAEGHGYYLQGAGEVSENIGFNCTGAIFHLYANGAGDILRNLTLTGNVAWGGGALQDVRPYRDWFIGVQPPSVKADNVFLKENMGYRATSTNAFTQVQIGREGVNGSLVVMSNYWPQGIVLNNWSNAVLVGNTIAPQNTDYGLDLQEHLTNLRGRWNNNSYVLTANQHPFRVGTSNYTFAEWKNVTGYDSTSTCTTGRLTGTKIFVRPNRYEAGRANIVVYNWDNLSEVAVNVSDVVAAGASYEVRNTQDFFSQPVLTGTFNGEPLRLPMNGLTTAKPMAALQTPAPTGPTFNVFVLLSRDKKNH